MFPRLLTYRNKKSFFLLGPRGVGKTQWIKTTFPTAMYFDLLDARTYTSFLADPRRLGDLIPKHHADWIVIDEVQRVPEILNEVHRLIESRKLPFVLTGSSARKLRRKGVNLLGGRAMTKHMHPLVPTELGSSFSLEHSLKFGSLPSVYVDEDPKAYLESYARTYLVEEVQQEGLTRNLAAFSRFMEIVTYSQAEVLTMAEVARECMVSPKVVQDYFVILEDLLLAARIPVFSKRAKRKLISHPKFFIFDAGVYAALRPRGPLDLPVNESGAALETLFLQFFRAVNEYKELEYQVFYWHTRNQDEVDFVLYGPRGLIAVEIKHSGRVRRDDLESLLLFKADYPAAKCFLVNLGSESYEENGIRIESFTNFFEHLDSLV